MIHKDETILVTASAKRLGKFIITDLIESGWSIALHYNKSQKLAEETAEKLIKVGGKVNLYQADLSKKSDIENLIDNLEAQDSIWTGLINNAGYFNYDNCNDFSFDDLYNHMSINFTAPAILTKALANYTIKMQKQKKNHKGFVINILDAKIFGLNPDYYTIHYLSKQCMALQKCQHFHTRPV